MTSTTASIFGATLEKTNRWLKEIAEELGGASDQAAYLALRCTMHALRDRLTLDETAQLAAQLPLIVRGVYYEGWDPSRTPIICRSRAEFIDRVGAECRADLDASIEQMVRAVFAVVSRHVSAGEIDDVKGMLPLPIRELWPET